MTFEQEMRNRLLFAGFMLDDRQLDIVISKCMVEMEAFELPRWTEGIEKYPRGTVAALWFNVKTIATAWAKENHLQATFLSVLDE